MSRIRRIVVAGALAVASVVPLTVAEAMPVTNIPAKAEKSSDVQQARWCGRWRCGGRRYAYRGRYWGPRYRYGYRRNWGPRVVIRPAAPRYVVRTGNRHVRWCMNNYRSYDASSDTFVSYDGDVRRCNSPYR
jgi:hypothetical protein